MRCEGECECEGRERAAGRRRRTTGADRLLERTDDCGLAWTGLDLGRYLRKVGKCHWVTKYFLRQISGGRYLPLHLCFAYRARTFFLPSV